MELAGKIALVTGAAQGIGESIARRFALEGAQVGAVDLNEEPIARMEEQSNGSICGIAADIGSPHGVRKAFDTVASRFGNVDILVACAATKPMVPLARVDEAVIDQALAVGVKGLVLCAQHASAQMRQRGGGAIITMSSFYARTPSKDRTVYIAVKGAVEALTRALAVELAEDNIRVNCLAPGPVLTPIRAARGDGEPGKLADRYRRAPMARFGRVEEVVDAVLFLATPRSSYMTGHVMALDGGLTIV